MTDTVARRGHLSRGCLTSLVLSLLLSSCPPGLPADSCEEESDCPACYSCDTEEHYCFLSERCPGGRCKEEVCCTGCWQDDSCLSGDAIDACGLEGVECAICDNGSACDQGTCTPPPVLDVALADESSCVLRHDGTVWCFGDGGSSQLGNGMYDGATSFARQVIRADNDEALANIVALSAGLTFACARDHDGGVWCWGTGSSGQLGNGDDASSRFAVRVQDASGTPLQGFTQVDAGDVHVCALRDEGSAWCWGYNSSGQLGQGAAGLSEYVNPVAMLGPDSAPLQGGVQVVAGTQHSCVLLEDRTVWCVGANDDRQLGNDSVVDSPLPVQVQHAEGGALTDVEQIAAGGLHSCALLQDGHVRCWGNARYGQLGDGGNAVRGTAVEVENLQGAVSLALGEHHSCALLEDASAMCWGANGHGQLGDGTIEQSNTPKAATTQGGTALGPLARLAGGAAHSCGLLDSGQLWCWGNNSAGQLGLDASSQAYLVFPQAVPGPPAVECAPRLSAAGSLGDEHGCAIDTQDRLWCWGANNDMQLGTGLNSYLAWTTQPVVDSAGGSQAEGYLEVASGPGASHSCAIAADRSAWCWGRGLNAQLGDGPTFGNRFSPTAVINADDSPLGPVRALAVGNTHTCALLDDGSDWVRCWGSDGSDQLGNGPSTTTQHYPVAVMVDADTQLGGVGGIAAGFAHSCALLESGEVRCWGVGVYGRLGDGTTTRAPYPVTVEVAAGQALSQVTQIAVGTNHSCALRVDGSLWCWGRNNSGQLGDGSTDDQTRPVEVGTDFGDVAQVSAGEDHTCAVKQDHTLWCWGANTLGQLGSGSIVNSGLPVQVKHEDDQPLTDVVRVSAGTSFTCAQDSAGALWCFGYNASGQLAEPLSLPLRTHPAPLALGCR